MTIEQVVDIIKTRLKKIDETNQFHEEYIRLAMSAIWNQLAFDTYRQKDFRGLDFFTKEYVSQTASQDVNTLEYYILLPAAILCAPDVDITEGVRNLNWNAERALSFMPVTSKSYSLYMNQDVLSVSNLINYIVRYDRIIFVDILDGSSTADLLTGTGVRFDLVVSLDEYDYTENFVAPGAKYEDFLLKTVNYLIGTPPPDLKNDNA